MKTGPGLPEENLLNAEMRATRERTNIFWGHNVQGFI